MIRVYSLRQQNLKLYHDRTKTPLQVNHNAHACRQVGRYKCRSSLLLELDSYLSELAIYRIVCYAQHFQSYFSAKQCNSIDVELCLKYFLHSSPLRLLHVSSNILVEKALQKSCPDEQRRWIIAITARVEE